MCVCSKLGLRLTIDARARATGERARESSHCVRKFNEVCCSGNNNNNNSSEKVVKLNDFSKCKLCAHFGQGAYDCACLPASQPASQAVSQSASCKRNGTQQRTYVSARARVCRAVWALCWPKHWREIRAPSTGKQTRTHSARVLWPPMRACWPLAQAANEQQTFAAAAAFSLSHNNVCLRF